MHKMFVDKYLEEKIKYQYYWKFLKNNIWLSFGALIKNAYLKCKELNTKIMNKDLNEVAKQ